MFKKIRGQREFKIVIADEVDSMLIDEGSKIVMLSERTPDMEHLEIILTSIFIAVNQYVQGFDREKDEGSGKYVFRDPSNT